MAPRISVIVPLYNKAPYIKRALDSIARQTLSDFEVIVVDDGSTDEGPQVVSEYTDKRFRFISQENLGPGAARNHGIEEASAKLIAFLDADDEWLPEYLEEGVRFLDEDGDVASVTFGYFADPDGRSKASLWQHRGLADAVHRVNANTLPTLLVSMLAYMSPCTTIARAAVLKRWGGFFSGEKCKYAEDAHLWLKVLLNEPVAFSLKPLARLHIEAASLSKNLSEVRPIEPFLVNPQEIETACPPHLRALLSRVLTIRALKTACVLGYWGHWRQASKLVARFDVPGSWRLPYFLPSLVCRTPLGGMLGRAWRKVA
jgi:glycosyltransferase involved in cell wall biosynthesis